MSAKGRDGLSRIFGSPEYMTWASRVANVIDARKLASEFAGTPKRTCGSKYAQGLQILCRENPPIPPVDPPIPPSDVPAPFSGRGMVLLEPTGGVEDMDAVKAAGFTYVLLNLAYIRGGSWDVVRQRCASRGIHVVPWRTVRSLADVAQIENTAIAWGTLASCHELENIQLVSPQALADHVRANWPARPRAVMTQPWAQNGAGWHHLSEWVGMPEAYLNASPTFLPGDLVQHLQEEGIPNCVPLHGWGVWADAPVYVPPSRYLEVWPSPRPFGVYFGDSREPQYEEWGS